MSQQKKCQVRIKICDNRGYPFIATLHNVILAPDLCDRLFSIITSLNQGHNYLFRKEFCTVYFGSKDNNAVTLPNSAQRKHAFRGKIKKMSKTKKLLARQKIDLEILHQILGHRSTRSLLDEDTYNDWEYIELRIDPDPFCTSYQISSMNKKARSKIPPKPKAPFKWVYGYNSMNSTQNFYR